MNSDLLLQGVRVWAAHYRRRFMKLTRNPEQTQERLLLGRIRRDTDTEFGRTHHFPHIRSVSDFRSRVPIVDYEALRPLVRRMMQGQEGVLFPRGTPILMYAMTSGTDGEPKYVPVTPEFLEDYRRGWRVWGTETYAHHPRAFRRRIVQVSSSWHESQTDGGVPCGAISGLNAEMQPWIVKRRYLPGSAVHDVGHAHSKYYLTGRIAVARRVSMMVAANPSSILSVVRAIDANAQTLIRDLHDGGVAREFDVPDTVTGRLGRHLKPDRKRARSLEKLLTERGRLLPKDYWPDLALLANWKGGTVGRYLRDYPEYFGDLPVREIGLLATEGRMTITVGKEDGASGVLDVSSHFFEFIPQEEVDRPGGKTLMTGEVEVGGRYGMITTTSGGLWRYNIRDVVEVTGFCGRTPVVRFLNKGTHIANITGEKLTEHQVVQALKNMGGRQAWMDREVVVSPSWGEVPGYWVTTEEKGDDKEGWGEFLSILDQELSCLNMEYREKRESGRLSFPRLSLVRKGTFQRLKEERLLRAGGRNEQYKHTFLTPEVDFHRRFEAVETMSVRSEGGRLGRDAD